MHFFFRDWLIPLAALVSGIVCYRYLQKIHRVFFWQLVFSLLVLLISHGITRWQKNQGIVQNNHFFMNIVPLLEPCFLIYAVRQYFQAPAFNKLSMLSYLIILLSATIEYYTVGFSVYLNRTDTLGCILLSLLYIPLLYRELTSSTPRPYGLSLVLISIGLLIYTLCSVPYLSIFSYISEHFFNETDILYKVINGLAANLRYLLLSIGFLSLSPKFRAST